MHSLVQCCFFPICNNMSAFLFFLILAFKSIFLISPLFEGIRWLVFLFQSGLFRYRIYGNQHNFLCHEVFIWRSGFFVSFVCYYSWSHHPQLSIRLRFPFCFMFFVLYQIYLCYYHCSFLVYLRALNVSVISCLGVIISTPKISFAQNEVLLIERGPPLSQTSTTNPCITKPNNYSFSVLNVV